MAHIIFVLDNTGLDESNEDAVAFITESTRPNLLTHCPVAPMVAALYILQAQKLIFCPKALEPQFSGPESYIDFEMKCHRERQFGTIVRFLFRQILLFVVLFLICYNSRL